MTPARKRETRGKASSPESALGADILTGERQACVEAGSTPKHHSQSGCGRVAGEGPLGWRGGGRGVAVAISAEARRDERG